MTDKNVISSSSATTDAAAAAKGKQLAAKASQFLAAEARKERFKADRCQWPLRRPSYGGCLLIECVVSLFADGSGDVTIILTDHACKEGSSTSTFKLTASVGDDSKQVLLKFRRNYRNRPSSLGICVAQIISQNLQCIRGKFVFIPQDMMMCGPTSSLYACVDALQTCIAFG